MNVIAPVSAIESRPSVARREERVGLASKRVDLVAHARDELGVEEIGDDDVAELVELRDLLGGQVAERSGAIVPREVGVPRMAAATVLTVSGMSRSLIRPRATRRRRIVGRRVLGWAACRAR